MAYQEEVGSGTNRATGYRDYLTKVVAFVTSQHVATVAVNSGGSGYTVGDILTLTHAGAYLDARFEVTSVSAGVITGLRIVSSGAFSNRAASATVSAGGSGYAVGDILEVQGGTARESAKFQVATLSGSAVATVSLFETGGAYSSTPSNPAATVGVGPTAFAGNDACTLTVTYSGLVGTTGLSVTGGTGSSATVDITLAQTGWSVDGRNTNNLTHNSLTDEKEVTLVGDATGFTNKPYVHLFTGTETSGLDTRYFMQCMMSVAHNSALAISAQPGLSTGYLTDSGSYILFAQNASSDSDFWIKADDIHMFSVSNPNPTATTDDGEYLHFYLGFHERLKTETEDPYPALVFASSRDRDANPSSSSTSITSIAECRAPGSGPGWYYRADGAAWTQVKNNDTGSVGQRPDMMFPFGEVTKQTDGNDPEYVVEDGFVNLNDSVIKRDRSASSRILLPMPGTTDDYLLYDLMIVRKIAADADETEDSPRGTVRGVYWIYNDDGSGSAINDFSEDYITIGGDRYTVFHNHVNTERYQYIAMKQDT